MDAINQANKPPPKAPVPSKSGRKNSEARGSEERTSGPPSKKRGRDLDTERVSGDISSPVTVSSVQGVQILPSDSPRPKSMQIVDTPGEIVKGNGKKSRGKDVEHFPNNLATLENLGALQANLRSTSSKQEDQYNAKPAIRIPVSDNLKSILVDDWENITKNLQLVSLPSTTPVNMILKDYMTYEVKRRKADDPLRDIDADSPHAELLEEVVAGLREYFNRALGRILLYRYERGQYEDMLARLNSPTDDLGGKQIADIYGAEHFLRLFGKPVKF
jgi:MRG